MKSKIRFLKNLAVLLVLVTVGILVVRFFRHKSGSDQWQIEDTPLKIELIRNISEIATVSYKDEVVVDSIEYYKSFEEQISGNINKLIDPDQWKYGISSTPIKRRLTLIVKGEVRFGFDIKNLDKVVSESSDTLRITFPSAKILDILVVPSGTEVFLENGSWRDSERKKLENKARFKLQENAERLNLKEKAETNLKNLMQKLLITDKKIIIQFN